MVKVVEYKRGLTRSNSYYFIIDGNKLVHISKYATSIRDKGEYIEYEVDLSRLSGKRIIEVPVSNSGIVGVVYEYPAEDLALPYQSRRVTIWPLSYLNKFEFEYLTWDEKKFLHDDWKQHYILMVEQIGNFLGSVKNNRLNLLRGNTSNVYISLPQLTQHQIDSSANYPLSHLIPYSAAARNMSLEGLTKEIHQIWVASRIIEELDRLNALKSLTPSSNNFQSLDFKQRPSYPIATFKCSCGICSLWYEFDLNVHTMCNGMFVDALEVVSPIDISMPPPTNSTYGDNPLKYIREYMRKTYSKVYEASVINLNKLPFGIRKVYERAMKIKGFEDVLKAKRRSKVPLRPDLVILCNINSCEDIKNASDIKFKAIIELKNLDIQYWLNDIDNQIIPYKQIFQPDIEVVASLKKVPDSIKVKLDKHGIKVIDEVYPGGKGEKDLLQIITRL